MKSRILPYKAFVHIGIDFVFDFDDMHPLGPVLLYFDSYNICENGDSVDWTGVEE